MKTMPNRSERGFTLIEIMIATAIATTVIGALFGTMLMQQQTYMAQMEQAEASQNARASLDIVRQGLRTAGWGMVATTGGRGVPAVGTCYNAALNLQSACNDLVAYNNGPDNTLADRVRFFGITAGTTFSRNTVWSGGSKLVVTDAGSPVTRTALQVGDLAIISGTCNDDSKAYNGVVKITNVNGTTTPWTYTFDGNIVTTYGYPAISCTTMKDGFAFGLAHIVEFYIDRGTPNTADPSPGAAENSAAHDVGQSRRGRSLEPGQQPHGRPNRRLQYRDPTSTLRPRLRKGTCWQHLLHRDEPKRRRHYRPHHPRQSVVQRLALRHMHNRPRRPRQPKPRHGGASRCCAAHPQSGPSHFEQRGSPRPLARKSSSSAPTSGQPDGYKHWIYRATIALRNNQLAVTGP